MYKCHVQRVVGAVAIVVAVQIDGGCGVDKVGYCTFVANMLQLTQVLQHVLCSCVANILQIAQHLQGRFCKYVGNLL